MFETRINKLRNIMRKNGMDGVLLVGDYNRNYLSGFTGDESFSVITLDKAIFITDSRFTQQAKEQVKDYEIRQYDGRFPEFLSKLVDELEIKKLGFEEDIISFSIYSDYKNHVKAELIPMKGIVEEIRIIKDKEEIEKTQKAADIADKAFIHMLNFIKAGMTEREIGLELEFFMRKQGAKSLSFPSIVASGVRSCLPHGEPTNKVVNNGEFLTLDYGCVFEDYCSDMTRTIVIGKPSEKMIEVYNVVLESQLKALEGVKPGAKGVEVDKIARDYIKEKGYGQYFGHGLGHGVGRQIHEAPRLSPLSDTVLKEGMVVTDEPGIYIPNFGGVRIEDLVLVTEDGYKVFSHSKKDLICI